MGKAKRKGPSLEEVLERPWCYYCERDFDDMKILINHQKAKHLKCMLCPRRLDTAGGLGVHMQQVHKEPLTKIENTIPGREDPEIEIFGVTGIPEDVDEAHRAKVTAEYHATHSSSGGGGVSGQPSKKAKLETPEELKKRLAEFKAKKAAAAAGETSGSASPMVKADSPASAQAEFHAPPSAVPANVFSGPQAASPVGYAQPFSPVAGAPGQYGQQPFSPHPQYPPQSPFPPPQMQQQPFPPQQAYSPQPFSPQSPFPGQPQYPGQSFSPPMGGYPMPGGPMAGPPGQRPGPGYPGFPPGPGGYMPQAPHHAAPFQMPPQGWQQGPQYPPAAQPPRPPQGSSLPGRPAGLPPAPGLPARPSFDAPPIDRTSAQNLHNGHFSPNMNVRHAQPASTQDAIDKLIAEGLADATRAETLPQQPHPSSEKTIESTKNHDKEKNGAPSDMQQVQQTVGASANGTPAVTDTEEVGQTNGAHKKDEVSKSAAPTEKVEKPKKPVIMVVRDQDTSLEERMARMSRYSYTPRKP